MAKTGQGMTRRRPAARRTTTLKDVAREAGVSIAAASYSLNGGGTIGEEVRLRVREVADRLGYRPNRSAQAVRTGRSMTLGLVLPDLNNPYYPALARSFEHTAREAGYTTILIDTSGSVEEELEGIRELENHGVAGAIWCQTSDQLATSADEYAMPIVVVGAPGAAFDNVMRTMSPAGGWRRDIFSTTVTVTSDSSSATRCPMTRTIAATPSSPRSAAGRRSASN